MTDKRSPLSKTCMTALGALLLHGSLSARSMADKLDSFGEMSYPDLLATVPTWLAALETLYREGYIVRIAHARHADETLYDIRLSVLVETRAGEVDDVSVYLHPTAAGHAQDAVREIEIEEPVTNWHRQKPENYDAEVWMVTPDGRTT